MKHVHKLLRRFVRSTRSGPLLGGPGANRFAGSAALLGLFVLVLLNLGWLLLPRAWGPLGARTLVSLGLGMMLAACLPWRD